MSLAPIPKSQILLDLIRREFPAYHPLLSIARIAHSTGADLKLQFECHKTIAKYVEPELKSIEVKTDNLVERRVTVSLFDPLEGEFTDVTEGTGDLSVQRDESVQMVTLPAAALANW